MCYSMRKFIFCRDGMVVRVRDGRADADACGEGADGQLGSKRRPARGMGRRCGVGSRVGVVAVGGLRAVGVRGGIGRRVG